MNKVEVKWDTEWYKSPPQLLLLMAMGMNLNQKPPPDKFQTYVDIHEIIKWMYRFKEGFEISDTLM
jgi:hypothetical protein